MENLWVMMIVGTIFIGYTSYTTYNSVKLFITFKKKLGEFQIAHKNAELYYDGRWMPIVTGILSVFSLAMAFFSYRYNTTDQTFYVVMAYVCIAIIFAGLAFETYVRKRAYLIEEGMFYVDQIYRYRIMLKFEQKGTVIKKVRITMGNGDKIEVSRKFGLFLEEKTHEHKKYKKDRKK